MSRLVQTTLDFISALRVQMALPEAISSLDALDKTAPECKAVGESEQLSLSDIAPESRDITEVKQWLKQSARNARVGHEEEEQRWDCFITIAKAVGLGEAVAWLRSNCLAMLVPDDENPWEQTRTMLREGMWTR